MSAGVAPGSAALRVRAAEVRGRAASLRGQATVQRQRADELCERVVENLLRSSARPFGAQGARFELRLARLRQLVGFARHELREWLEGCDVPSEVVSDITLAFSEAFANAVEHPSGSRRQLVEVAARRKDDQIELRVRDFGTWSEHARSDLRGRGLHLIGELVDSLDVQQDVDGTKLVMRCSF